jgi:hypothetical protein
MAHINPDEMHSLTSDETKPTDSLLSPDDVSSLLDDGSVVGEVRKNQLTGQIVSAQGKAMEPMAINQADASLDHRAALEEAAQGVYNSLEGELANAAGQSIAMPGGDATLVAQQLAEGQNLINNNRVDPISTELAIIQNAANIPLADAVRREVALNLAATNEMARMIDEMGLMDFLADGTALMLPLRETAAWEQIKEGVEENDVLSLYMTGDSISGMITSWQNQPTARKEVLFPVLVKTITDSLAITTPSIFGGEKMEPNTLLAVSALMRFFQPEGAKRATQEQRAILALDVADIGLSAVAIAQRATRVAKAARATAAPSQPVGGPRRPSPEGFGIDPNRLRDTSIIEGEVISSTVSDIAKLPKPVRQQMEMIMYNAADLATRLHSLPNLVARAGDIPQAARINLAAMDSPEIARAFNISTDDAITNAMPFQTNEWMPQAIEGLVPETANAINDFLRASEKKVRSMTTESDLLRVGALDKSDRKRVVRNFLDEMERTGEDMMMEGITLSRVDVTKELADGFEFEYTITRTSDGIPENVVGRRSWKVNQVTGNYDDTVVDLAGTTTASIPGLAPTAWSVTKPGAALDFNDVTKTALQLEDIAVASKTRINELWLDANTSISGPTQVKARARVNDVELAGDEYVNPDSMERGRVFTSGELMAGIQTRTGTVRLTNPAEVEAYYKRRLVADAFHSMQNFVTRRELELGGFKSTFVSPSGEDLAILVKPFDDAVQAMSSIRNKTGFEAWDTATKSTNVMSPEYIARVYEDGKVLARLREDWNVTGNANMRGGRSVEYIVMDPANVKQLPEQVVNYHPGYVPKINEGIEFVVKQLFPYKKAGTTGKSKGEALRAFASRKDAEKFQVIMATKYAAKYDIPLEDALLQFELADGSAMGQMERMENALSGTSGLFTGTRAADDLLMGLDGVEIERMNPSEAYGRYIDHLGTKVAKNEWRIGRETDWLNTVRRQVPEAKVNGFNGTILPDTDKGKALDKLRDQINKWNRVPSRKESLYEAAIQGTHDWVLEGARGLGLKKESVPSILYLKHMDPASAVMSASMHTMLGTLNPAQLYVQASAAVVALSLRPIRDIPLIMGRSAAFGIFDNMRDVSTVAKAMRRLRKSTDTEVRAAAEDLEVYQLWRRSGQWESVRSNADMNYMSNTGLGLTNDVLRNAGNVSLMFYRSAELLNRRVSFISAYDTIKAQSKGRKVDDDFLADVLKLSNLTMLELNAANKAWWQGGQGANGVQKTLAMSTQFLQVLTKTVELIAKGPRRGGFDNAQKRRIAAGQWLMFGAAGVPLTAMVGPAFVDWVGDKASLDDNNPADVELKQSIANTVNQGTAGFLAHEMFGAKIEVAGRAALASGILESVKDIITSKDPLWIKALGVSGETGRRFGGAVIQTSAIAKSHAIAALAELEPFSMADRRGQPNLSTGNMVAAAADIAALMGTIPSLGRQLLKARMMNKHNIIMDRRGRVTVKADFDLATEVGVALGFQTTRETRLRSVQQTNMDNTELVRAASDVIVSAYHRLAYIHDNSPDNAESVHILVQYVQEALDNDSLVEELRSSLNVRIFSDPKTLEERELLKFFERTASDKISQGLVIDAENALNPSKLFSKQAVVIPFADTLKREGE